jgi:hypothetical protein
MKNRSFIFHIFLAILLYKVPLRANSGAQWVFRPSNPIQRSSSQSSFASTQTQASSFSSQTQVSSLSSQTKASQSSSKSLIFSSHMEIKSRGGPKSSGSHLIQLLKKKLHTLSSSYKIVKVNPHVTSLSIKEGFVNAKVIEFIALYLPSLKEIKIENSQISKEEVSFLVQRLPQLESLILRNWGCSLDNRDLIEIGTHLSYLKRLEINGDDHFTDGGLVKLARFSPHLECLRLGSLDNEFSSKSLKALAQLEKLRDLELSGHNHFTEEGLSEEIITKLSRYLEVLILTGTQNDLGDHFLKALARVSHLQVLELHGDNHFTNEGLLSISRLSSLRTLCLYGPENVFDLENDTPVLENLKEIRRLVLYGSYNSFSEGFLALLARYAPKLEYLLLEAPANGWYTRDDLKALASLSNLSHLELDALGYVSIEILDFFGPALNFLVIQGIRKGISL